MGKRMALFFLPVLILSAALGETLAADSRKIQANVLNTIDIQQQKQKAEATWQREQASLVAEYERLLTVKEEKEKIKHQREKALSLDKLRVDAFERKITETKRIKDELTECLKSILSQLELRVEKDLSFLPEEREKRLSIIRADLENPDVSPDEKFRVVFEAFAVEAGFADTTEVYPETILIEGGMLHVDVLRLGRLALFFSTPDRKKAGVYHPLDEKWHFLPEAFGKRIGRAMEISAKRRIADFVNLPIGRIVVK